MIRRLALLNGLAIVAVVLNHAAQLAIIAMTQWLSQSPALTLQVGDPRYDIAMLTLTTVEKLAVFSVPAFLFFAGFFLAFASRGNQSGLSWKFLRSRISSLLIPYLIWSMVIFGMDAMRGQVVSPLRYGLRLLYGGAIPHYFFVPLLIQLYLLSPFLVMEAKDHPRRLLIFSGMLQLFMSGLMYLDIFMDTNILEDALVLMHYWSLFPMWIFFFTFGMVVYNNQGMFRQWIYCYRHWLLALTVACGILAVVEMNIVGTSYNLNWRDLALTLPSTLYALGCIISFLAYERFSLPFSSLFTELSKHTYGIYLVHTRIIGFVAALIALSFPWLLGKFPLVALVGLVVIGVGLPFLVMNLLARSRARRLYPYFFG